MVQSNWVVYKSSMEYMEIIFKLMFYLAVLKNYYFVFMCTWASMPQRVCVFVAWLIKITDIDVWLVTASVISNVYSYLIGL